MMLMSDRNLTIMIIILLIILIAPMYVLSQKESREEQLLKDEGLETLATVLNVHYSKTSKKATRNYYMEVAFFSNDSNKNKSEIEENKSIAEHPIDTILSKMRTDVSPIGQLNTVTIPIQGISAGKYKKNDKVKIIYLPQNPKVLRLKEEI